MIFAAASNLTPAQEAMHNSLKAVWVAATDPVQKDAAYKALVAYDASLPPPPPPPAPAPVRASAAGDFLTENKTTLLVGGGALLAAGIGYWAWKRRKR
jgi:LPXTG-motif cell wall-anchored protein